MPLFRELISNSNSTNELQSFVIGNIHRFHDLNNGHFNYILEEKNDIRDFIELKAGLLSQIDYESSQCKAFISILFDFCERFGFICTTRIENTLSHRNLFLGRRREAAKLFLLNVRSDIDYINRFEQICTLLQCSIEIEEDSEKRPVVTFLNYIAKVIRDTSHEIITAFQSQIRHHSTNNTFPFLLNPVIQEICSIPVIDNDLANSQVQSLIEIYLGHVFVTEPEVEETPEEVIIESDTPYSQELKSIPISFNCIRRIALDRCAGLTLNIPGRGVAPLRSELEMFFYLKRYGNMHKSKLLSSFETFSFQTIDLPIEIIDWGCGQGLASIVLIDYLSSNNIPLEIKKIVLIEPSELCLKRAALHISLARNNIPLRTICSFFNNLSVQDIHTSSDSIKFHFFSNILDIDESLFSLANIIHTIEATQRGINYFFCISPYINDEKADRVDSFKRHFQAKYDSYECLFEASNSGRLDDIYWNCNRNYNGNQGVYCTHPACGCEEKWTRIIRVFKVNI